MAFTYCYKSDKIMAHAKLHMICGNCGSNDQFTYRIVTDYDDDKEQDYPRISIACNNCSTLHYLEDNAAEEIDE